MKPLGLAAPKRSPALPDVPTLEEQGINGVESNNWCALYASAKTPQTKIDELNAAVRKVLTSEPYRTRLVGHRAAAVVAGGDGGGRQCRHGEVGQDHPGEGHQR